MLHYMTCTCRVRSLTLILVPRYMYILVGHFYFTNSHVKNDSSRSLFFVDINFSSSRFFRVEFIRGF